MRIISLSPSITEIIFAIGKGNSIVGNTYFCDYPASSKKIEKVGSWTTLNFDKIKKLKPDFTFTTTIVQKRLNFELLSNGFNNIHFDPRSLKEIYKMILKLGSIVNSNKEAQELVAKMKNEESKFKNKKPKNPAKIYIEEWFTPPMVSGNWVPGIVRLVGASYDLVKNGEISRKIALEELLNYGPDYILLSYCGFGKNSSKKHILNREGWNKLKAVRQGKIFAVDDNLLNRPGPRILEAALEIKRIINS